MDGDIVTATGDVFGKRRKRKNEDVSRSGNNSKKIDDVTNKKATKPDARPKDGGADSSSVTSQVFRGINVAEFIEARALEVSNTVKALREAERMEGKRVFQSLPRHMRRRAASYDIRRIPRSQRKAAAKEDEKNPVKKTKMPSRKHRRRPKILLQEYNRRKRKNAWLETHIWHAKRFEMVEKWGYKVAEQPNDKGLRSAYRASANGCLMQDMSFYGCIEIIGPERDIIEAFTHLTSKNTGPEITAKRVLSGERALDILLYGYDFYPSKAIGPVKVIWKPVSLKQASCSSVNEVKQAVESMDLKDQARVLWIWCHPSFHDEAVETIREAFVRMDGKLNEKMDVECTDSIVQSEVTSESRQDVKKEKMVQNTDSKDSTDSKPSIYSETFKINETVILNSKKLDFVYIRLTGPLSHKVLVDSFQLHQKRDYDNKYWWDKFYSRECSKDVLDETLEAWETLKQVTHAAELPANVVFALTIVDPRMNLPIKKTWAGREAVKEASSEYLTKKKNLLTNWSRNLCHSPIWNENIRGEVKKTKLSDADLNKMRSTKLDVGEHFGVDKDTSRIPVLLIQRPGGTAAYEATSQYGSGWDVIIPSRWGMAFWVSMIYRGAHASGLREERSVALESRRLYFPKEYPDSQAGKNYIEAEEKHNQESHFRRPASKRPNFATLGISSPFAPDWQALIREWHKNVYTVLKHLRSDSKHADGMTEDVVMESEECRSGDFLDPEELMLGAENGKDVGSFYVLRDAAWLRKLGELIGRFAKNMRKHGAGDESLQAKKEALLHELLNVPRNALIAISLVCISKGEATNNAEISIPNSDDFDQLAKDKKYNGPTEPLHKGRKELFPTVASMFGMKGSQATCTGQCTRWIVGHVTSGRYSLSSGRCAGVGFASAAGLAACIAAQKSQNEGCIVLVRNITSLQYRFAKIAVIT